MFMEVPAIIQVSVYAGRSARKRSEFVKISYAGAAKLYAVTLSIIIAGRQLLLSTVVALSSRMVILGR